jgi:long-chain acyl-CoA synthetase
VGLYDYSIFSFIKRNASVYADRAALISYDRKISYKELFFKINELAIGLKSLGIKKGDRIGVLAQNCPEYYYLYGAAAKIGAIILPINWRLKSEEISYIIEDGAPRAFFVDKQFEEILKPLILEKDLQKRCIGIDPSTTEFPSIKDLLKNKADCPEADVALDDPFVIIYTAGVCGMPRGATISHGNILFFNLQSLHCWSLTPDDAHILLMPLSHNFGLTLSLIIMQVGGVNIILPKFDVDLALEHIQRDKATIFGEFHPMLDSLLHRASEGGYDLSSIRVVIGIDRPETVKKFEEMTQGTYWTGYAQTETTGFISLAPYSENPGSSGIPKFLTEIKIVDDFGRAVERNQAGEISVRGPMVFKGYWNRQEDNAHIFRGGWHHTGDLGRFDDRGYLWYIGRTAEKELIKPGGENVYPAEVEQVIFKHPLVKEVAVIGVPDPEWGEAVKAVCVLKENRLMSEMELIEYVGSKIAGFKKPKYVHFVSELPKIKNGTIDRNKIKALYGSTEES